jgi:phospholipid transport system substrate-binding protein
MRHVAIMTAILLGAMLAGRAAEAADSPMQVLKKANQKIEKILDQKLGKGADAEKKRDDKLKKVVDGFLDFDALAQKSLGKHWKERTDEEKAEFKKLFRELVQKNYLKQIHEKADYDVIYDDEEIEDSKATVNTTVKAKNKKGEEAETSLVYKLKKKKGKWLVVDIITDEVSLVQNYRSQFAKIIKKDSYEVLVEKIEKKIEENKEEDDEDIE